MSTLDSAAIFLSGGTPKKSVSEYWNGDIPWYSASNMHSRFLFDDDTKISDAGLTAGSKLAPEGATLLLVRGSGLFNYIPICFAERDVAFNQDVKAICPKDHVDPKFLHFWIESLRPELANNLGVTGIGAGKFDTDFLKALPFPAIDKSTQKKIGNFSSAFDYKIELNRKMNETLEAMAQAVFRDWFVDFGPTRRKLAGETDPLKIMGGLTQDKKKATHLANLFPDTLGTDGLPEGWEDKPLTDFIEIIGGGTPKTKNHEYWNGNIPWFSVADTPSAGSVFVHQTEKSITEKGLNESSARLIPSGATIISARGTVGNLAIAGQDMTFNQSCYGLQPKDSVGDFFTFLMMQRVVAELKSMAHGSVFSTITRATFESVNQNKASQETLEAFDILVAPLFSKVNNNVQENQTLAKTRDLLLPKLMSGEIQLTDQKDVDRA